MREHGAEIDPLIAEQIDRHQGEEREGEERGCHVGNSLPARASTPAPVRELLTPVVFQVA